MTDHQALKSLLTAGGTGRCPLCLYRWTDRLFQYTFSVVYRPGKHAERRGQLPVACIWIVRHSVCRSFGQHSERRRSRKRRWHRDPDNLRQPGDFSDDIGQGGYRHVSRSRSQWVLQHVLHGWPSFKPEVASELRSYFNVQAELSVAVYQADVFFEAAASSSWLCREDNYWKLLTKD